MFSKCRYGAVLVLGLFLAGCGMQSGDTLVKFEKGGDAHMTTAPKDAQYALYSTDDITPIVKYTLSKGDKIGFEANSDGTVNAIAGSNSQAIKTSMLAHNFYWKEEKGD